jgi:hypothetical protein
MKQPYYLVALIGGLVLLYPLSSGPVMARQRQMAGTALPPPTFYKPLIEISKVSPAFRDLLRWYLECWGMPVNKHPRKNVRL